MGRSTSHDPLPLHFKVHETDCVPAEHLSTAETPVKTWPMGSTAAHFLRTAQHNRKHRLLSSNPFQDSQSQFKIPMEQEAWRG